MTDRAQQLDDAERLLRLGAELGYARVCVRVTRGGSLEIDVERDVDKAQRQAWGSGRK